MAMEQYFQDSVTQTEFTDDKPSVQKWKSIPDAVDGSENNLTGGFDCNICLDTVQDPVVTLCGHLYCWPCIYKWIHYQSVSTDNLEKLQPQCPVCKAEVSEKSIVPLYGRGQTTDASESERSHFGIVIPQRPASPRCGFHTLITTTATTDSRPAPQLHQLHHRRGYPQQPQPYSAQPGSYPSYPGTPMVRLGETTVTNAVDPVVGMIGEMVYARIFGNPETTLYSYPNSYNVAGSSSPRVRRHVMEADKSLSRICFFLFCCLVLCLLLF